jgi:hypothetical protein
MVSDEGTKGKRGPMGSFARNHPVAFVLASTMAWLVLLLVLMGIASSALRTPYDDPITGTVGRLAVTACVLLLVWHLGWMKAAGVTRLGRRQVWLLALGGMVYFAVASLYSLYGQVSFDFSSLIRLPESRTALTTQLVVAMGEEVLFSGLSRLQFEWRLPPEAPADGLARLARIHARQQRRGSGVHDEGRRGGTGFRQSRTRRLQIQMVWVGRKSRIFTVSKSAS